MLTIRSTSTHSTSATLWLLATLLVGHTTLAAENQPAARRASPWTQSRLVGSPTPPPPFRVAFAFEGLKFDRPVALTSAPGEDHLFLLQQDGKLLAFENKRSVQQTALVIDLKKREPKLGSAYGITFHPDYQRNHYVYLCYVYQGTLEKGSRLVRFATDGAHPPKIDPASAQTILTWVSGGHNGGCVKFGPDGYLYISTGDASGPAPPDVHRAGQDVSNLLSSILRIDVDNQDPGLNYAIPKDNPLVSVAGARGEVWSYGYRNPWKMSFDRVDGHLWVGDVGWELWEMIYRVKKGGNYGWSITEGPQPVHPEDTPGPTPILPPTLQHPHSEAASITGGFVYRGTRLSGLTGAYVYGDFQTGILWGARLSGEEVSWHQEVARSPLQLVAFGEDTAGELYLVDYRGQIFQLQENPQPDRSAEFPRRLSQTGLFASTTDLTPAAGVIPYQINASAWADHTAAQRWLAIPGQGQITADGPGKWKFPDGSVLVKTIHQRRSNAIPRKLETQILHREDNSWRPYTYVWNDAGTDAELAPAGGLDLALAVDPASPSPARWRVHSRSACLLCHNPWVEARTTVFGVQSASPLAVDETQWSRLVQVAGTPVSQLQHLHDQGLLALATQSDQAPAMPLVDPTDEAQTLDRRARSYLHVNCAHCHQFNAGGAANIALSHQVPLANTGTLGTRPTQGTFGITGARIISPGDPLGSVLYYRISKLGGGRMPRLGSVHVDVAGASMIHDWIANLTPQETVAPHPITPRLAARLASNSDTDRTAAITTLTTTTRGALALLRWVADHPDPRLRTQVLAATRTHPATEVRDLFERFLPPDQRVKRLGTVVDRGAILRLPANAEQGRTVFFNNPAAACKNCHRIGKQGETLGPDLSTIGKKYGAAQLLDQILEPSKLMDPKYVPYLMETAEGQILTGLLEKKTDEEVWIKDARNRIHKIPAEEIELLVRQRKSLMPELLLRDLTAQQVADLVAFLATLK